MKNPLRLDPTQTGLIRRGFTADLLRRFSALQTEVRKAVQEENQFGMITITGNAARFVFETNPRKMRRFRKWLEDRVNSGVLQLNPATGEPRGVKPWTYKYIESAYRKGATRAYLDTHKRNYSKPQAFYEGSKAEFMRSTFADGERVSKMEMLYLRSYENLRGITSAMSQKMSQIFADGMANGKSPMKLARELNKAVSGIGKKRARVLARTEIVHAHAEGQLDSFEDLEVKRVGARVEFTDAGDDGVCPKCHRLNGKIYTIRQARGLIPVHPNCRCCWGPVIEIPKHLLKRKSR